MAKAKSTVKKTDKEPAAEKAPKTTGKKKAAAETQNEEGVPNPKPADEPNKTVTVVDMRKDENEQNYGRGELY